MGTRDHDGRVYNLPSTSEVAALVVGISEMEVSFRDIVLQTTGGRIQRINELHPAYIPLQYPLLFIYGEDGYKDDILHNVSTLEKTKVKKRISIREFISYRLMFRGDEMSLILRAGKLLQQFIVDSFTMMESQRLLWVQTHQKKLRADLYTGLSDAVLNGETHGSSTGKRIVLPSSFTGGPRYMMGNYQDAMAICRAIGYPQLFITFTCNPKWPEVTRVCRKYDLDPHNCPHILTRIFYLKFCTLMKLLKQGVIFGKIRAGNLSFYYQ